MLTINIITIAFIYEILYKILENVIILYKTIDIENGQIFFLIILLKIERDDEKQYQIY